MRHLGLIYNSGILDVLYLQCKFYFSLNRVEFIGHKVKSRGNSIPISCFKLGFWECRNEGDEAFLGSLWQDYQEALGLVRGFF